MNRPGWFWIIATIAVLAALSATLCIGLSIYEYINGSPARAIFWLLWVLVLANVEAKVDFATTTTVKYRKDAQ